MWQNWKPNFYATTNYYSVPGALASIFKCVQITYNPSNQVSNPSITWNSSKNTLDVYGLNSLSFQYANNIQTVKFKTTNNGIIVDFLRSKITDLTGVELNPSSYHSGFKFKIEENNTFVLEPASYSSVISFEYIVEFGLEDDTEPYYWDNKDWTPNQLKFPSTVKYSNISTEDKNDTGSAVLLPEISSSANANNYEQDENGNCYVKDNEGNIVYNKFLNKLARKTKINNGYRINGNQSLELLSFNNNIYDYDKQSGQYLFSGNKKQTYGNKENTNQTIQKQNVPYFGGQPAIYPVVIYNNTNQILFDDLSITKTSNKITINQTEYDLKEQDLLVTYIREHGEWIPKKNIGTDNSDSSIKYWSFQKGSVYTSHRIAILSSGANSAELKFSRMKTYNIQDNITFSWDGQSIPTAFNEIFLHDFFSNIIVPENKTIQIPIKNVSDFSMFTTLTNYDSACSIGNYNYEKSYQNLSWNNHCNFSMTVVLKDFSTIQINSTEVNEYDTGIAAKEEQTTTGDIYAFTDAEGRRGLSRYYRHIAILQGNLKSAPGTFPLRCNYFNGNNKKTILSNTYGHEEYFETSDAYSVFPDLIKVNDKEYSYNYHYDNTEDTSSTLVDVDHLSLYLNFAYLNTTYKKYAIAVVIWKNGKLLENS